MLAAQCVPHLRSEHLSSKYRTERQFVAFTQKRPPPPPPLPLASVRIAGQGSLYLYLPPLNSHLVVSLPLGWQWLGVPPVATSPALSVCVCVCVSVSLSHRYCLFLPLTKWKSRAALTQESVNAPAGLLPSPGLLDTILNHN